MNFEQIISHLQANGWPVERLGDTTARSSFTSANRTFPFFVHIDAMFVTLAAVPYARLPASETAANKLMDRLLHLNREINLAKFSVDDDGDVVLSVEYPLADLQDSEVCDALQAICFYAERHWEEVSALADS